MYKLRGEKRDKLIYKKLAADLYDAACSLCISVFDKEVAPLNPPYGRDTFVKFVNGHPLRQAFDKGDIKFYGCFDSVYSPEKLVGIIAIKNVGRQPHISLLFVSPDYAGMGIGTELIKQNISETKAVTVNASINAEGFYEKQGFRRTAGVVFEDGLKTIPMKKDNYSGRKSLLSVFLSVVIPVLIALYALSLNGIFPFGDKSFLIYDLKSQYIDFYNSFSRIFSGDFFYSFSRTLGGDNFTLNAYYLFSPFNLILLLFSKERMADGVLLIYLLKTAAAGFSFAFCMSRSALIDSKNRGFYILLPVVSTAFALCGFAVSYSLNVFWLDCLILLPFLSLSLEKAIKGKPTAFITISALSLIINFYFGYMLVIFSLTAFFAYSKIISISHTTINFKTFFKYTAISCMLSGIVTVPVLFGLFATKLSPSNPLYAVFSAVGYNDAIGMVNTLLLVFAIVITLISVGERFLPKSKNNKEKRSKLSSLFADDRVKKLTVLLPIILLILLICTDLEKALNIFMSLLPTYQNVNETPIFITMTAAIIALIFVFIPGVDKEKRVALTTLSFGWLVTLLIKPIYLILHMGQQPLSYPGRYVFIVAFLLLQNVMISSVRLSAVQINEGVVPEYTPIKTAGLILITFLMCFEIIVNTAFTFGNNEKAYYGYTDRDTYAEYIIKNTAVIDKIKKSETGFFRTEKTYNRSLNDAYTFGTSGIAHYSSMYENEIINTMNLMGLSASAYWVQYKGSTPITDMLFGINYVLDDNILTTFYQEKYYKKQFSENGISVYKNPYALPIAIAVPDGTANLIADTIDPFTLQNNFVKAVTGSDIDPFSDVKKYNREKIIISDDENYGKSEGITYTLEIEKSGGLFMCIKYGTHPVRIFVNGEYMTHYFTDDTSGSVYLGDFSAGEKVVISLEAEINKGESVVGIKEENEFFAILDFSQLEKAYNIINSKTKSINAGSGKIDVTTEGEKMLLLSLPYSQGWKAKVDGADARTLNVGSGFLAVDMGDNGMHNVELVYTPPGLGRGILISLLGILTFMLTIKRKTRKSLTNADKS